MLFNQIRVQKIHWNGEFLGIFPAAVGGNMFVYSSLRSVYRAVCS